MTTENTSQLLTTDKRTIIITGAYGSGKTECALELALQLAAREAVTLVDLDFVNPYFRSLDHRDMLERRGVQVVAPALTQIDAPALPPAARDVILHPHGRTLVDLGGDPAGAIVIGQFAPQMIDYELWAVVNFSRPTTATPAQATSLLQAIATATRLQLTGLISNTHLGEYTTAEDMLDGLAQARTLGEMLGIPVVLACAPDGLALPPLSIPLLRITRRLRRPWD